MTDPMTEPSVEGLREALIRLRVGVEAAHERHRQGQLDPTRVSMLLNDIEHGLSGFLATLDAARAGEAGAVPPLTGYILTETSRGVANGGNDAARAGEGLDVTQEMLREAVRLTPSSSRGRDTRPYADRLCDKLAALHPDTAAEPGEAT